ncbi:MAG TPA: hypothetical protein VM582_05350 [Candidatus Thermoplasmatota archaeon]|nr:hypothetical protein [Candidatus Thermoplasmatota archaeon]
MPSLRLALVLALGLLLPGCAFLGGGAENSDGAPDLSDYDGGVGFALAVTNAGQDPFDVALRVLGVGNAEVAQLAERLEPGATIEKWWSLEERSRYSARLNYVWSSSSGSTSHGLDDQTFDANECPNVSRLAWELRQSGTTVGHAFMGKTCVEDPA